MRRQIRGLSQASDNAKDGISAVQTAEGALQEVQDMLQRMSELGTKAANDTLTSSDRNYIQKEVNQLSTEITRTATVTEFNNQKLWVLKLDPSKYKGQFTQMEVWLSKKDFSPKRLYTVDPSGNGSWYNIVNLSVVKSWKSEDFKYKPVKGVDEIDMR
jgi:outer membrane lipoprotein-sorting protein